VRVPELAKTTHGSLSSDFKPLPEKRLDERIIPVDLQRFRLYTGAPIFVDFKSIPYKDTEVIEWRRRIGVAEDIQRQPREGDRAAALAQARAEGITHLIVPAEVTLPDAGLDETYADAYYHVYRLARAR